MRHIHSDGTFAVAATDGDAAKTILAALKAAGITSKADLVAFMDGIEDDLSSATTAAQALPPLRKLARLMLFLVRHGSFSVE
jgi:hypothetical protein